MFALPSNAPILVDDSSDWDVFICCASYEDRCLSVARALDASKVDRVFVCENSNFESVTSTHRDELDRVFQGKADRVVFDGHSPLTIADEYVSRLGTVVGRDTGRVLIDITTFTRESLLILIRFLHATATDPSRFHFAYTRAAEYDVGQTDPAKVWLSRGVRDIRSVLGFPGEMRPDRPNHLLILVGYEHERAIRLIEQLEPTSVSLGDREHDPELGEKRLDTANHFQAVTTQPLASASGYRLLSGHDSSSAFEPRAV